MLVDILFTITLCVSMVAIIMGFCVGYTILDTKRKESTEIPSIVFWNLCNAFWLGSCIVGVTAILSVVRNGI